MDERIENLRDIYINDPADVTDDEIEELIKAGVDIDELMFRAVQKALE